LQAVPPADHLPSRRTILAAGGLAAGWALSGCSSSGKKSGAAPTRSSASPTPVIRKPDSRPRPDLPEGTDTLPQIEHIVILMMENHSYDNYLGMLRRGDGLPRGANGKPTSSNADSKGRQVRSYHFDSTCQLPKIPKQDWNDSHIQWDHGRNDGFVRSGSGPIAMGYWTGDDLPFYYGLAQTFPVADRYFGSVLAQTYPNRRFLMAGTAYGLVGDPFPSLTDPHPPNGTIFDRLAQHGITWKNYASGLASILIIPSIYQKYPNHVFKTADFLRDAAAGTLPQVSLVDPDFDKQSEENPQNILVGEAFSASIINAVMHGPAWDKTLLIWCYDEHGGYYDHVPPPPAIAPDSIRPDIAPTDQPGGYDRYGFRVPCVLVSPRAKAGYVSHVVHDHTSILKLIETKWNLPALTYRDANASNMLDSIDLKGKPAFADPPRLPAPKDPSLGCASGPLSAQPPDAL
jgi:phospholipase C